MKYYKWIIYFEENSLEGSDPISFVVNDGGWLEGAFDESFTIYGYGSDNLDLSKYSQWQIEEISQEFILSKYTELFDLPANLNDDGKIKMPHPHDWM